MPRPDRTIGLLKRILALAGKTNELMALMSRRSLATKPDIKKLEKQIMASEAEVIAELKKLKADMGKVRTEVVDAKTELAATIKSLEDIIAAGNTGEASAALVEIKDELVAEFKTLDDLHLDKATPA